MNIQFSIIGLAIVLVFYLSTAGILVLIGLRINDKRWKKIIIAPLALIALVLPWVHEVLVAWNFREVCEDAGAQISRTVTVEGFLNDISRSSSDFAKPGLITDPGAILNFDRSGYRYIESLFKDGKVWHLERVEDGVQASLLSKPTARYHFTRPMSDVDAGRAASCSEDVIIDSETKQTIAKYRYCKRYASFPERIWLGLLHRGPIEYCPSGERELKGMLYHDVLIPVRKR